ncbi:MAG: hypothetical protein IPN93_07005 [Bacteroidetes bacterium]|nr:hypothetical protein [Bacteroidota bacterium]
MGIFNFFNTKNSIELQKRLFEPIYFKNPNTQKEIEQQGFSIIKQACSEEMIDYMKSSYEKLTQMEGYETKDLFVNSGRFESSQIRNFAINAIEHFSTQVLSTFVNIENCDYKNGGSF